MSTYAASETGDHTTAAHSMQGVTNYQLPAEQMSSLWTSQQSVVASANVYAQETG